MGEFKEDLTGRIFGKLTVVERAEDYIEPQTGYHRVRWVCECNCEAHTRVVVHQKSLLKKNNPTRSCGCLRKEICKKRKKYNRYDISGQYGVGWTFNTGAPFYFDLEDYDKIKDYCWTEQISNTGYHSITAYINGKTTRISALLGFKWNDHKNRNPLDNRKENLRPCSPQENAMNCTKRITNTSGVIGVYFNKRAQKWVAQINIDKKTIGLGSFIEKDQAIKTRLNAEYNYYGDFAPQKHLFEQYNIKQGEDVYE